MRTLMCKLWTNFAKHHDPTPDYNNPLGLRWEPVQSVAKDARKIILDYLVINDNMKMVRKLNKQRTGFWKGIYRRFNKGFVASKL